MYSEGTMQFLLASFILEYFSGFDNSLANILLIKDTFSASTAV